MKHLHFKWAECNNNFEKALLSKNIVIKNIKELNFSSYFSFCGGTTIVYDNKKSMVIPTKYELITHCGKNFVRVSYEDS